MQALPQIAKVEQRDDHGVALITATPQNGAFVADAVATALRAGAIDVRSLDVEQGGLDDVFHRLTREAPLHVA
jgi:hypothetical protein